MKKWLFIIWLFPFVASGGTGPAESPIQSAYVRYASPPDEYTYGMVWVNATQKKSGAFVQVRKLQLVCSNGEKKVILADGIDTAYGMGLYPRNPWFGKNDKHITIPVSNPVGMRKGKVTHFWTKRVYIPKEYKKCHPRAALTVKNAYVQVGLDYWPGLDSYKEGKKIKNVEAMASRWYTKTFSY